MIRLRELTPVRNAKGQYTGRYEYRLNPYALNSVVTYSTIAGSLISGISILIADLDRDWETLLSVSCLPLSAMV